MYSTGSKTAYGPITVRLTNVYEEKSLGVFTDDGDDESEEGVSPPTAFKRLHLDDANSSHDQVMGVSA